MYYMVYETRNLVNGKRYRGAHKTAKLNDGYLGSGRTIKKAIAKYGKHNFVRHTLAYARNIEDMYALEHWFASKEWILANLDNVYNIVEGGGKCVYVAYPNPQKGVKFSESHVQKLKEAWIPRKEYLKLHPQRRSEESKRNIRNGVRKAMTPEVRRKISEAKKNQSVETREKISKALTGRKGPPMLDHVKENLRRINKGRPLSDEQKRKMAESRRKWWASRTAEQREQTKDRIKSAVNKPEIRQGISDRKRKWWGELSADGRKEFIKRVCAHGAMKGVAR